MPTNEERREVAARLRDIDTSNCYTSRDVLRAIEDACRCNVGQDWQDMAELKDRLADLIEPDPERTCKAIDDFVLPGQKQTYPYKICSNCHSDFPRLISGDGFLVENYCPNCGAKVVI